ncbi:hypothetical protein OIU79_030070 [Salix purpurea]|uniref:Uncharacterized protein n=1 Tax=Salix purpurea TaxID=77065 RepID=A0A9Q0ZWG3_SALPP|nr:hypothetical protein OIU79_030070 [Salix purpurea]
MPISEGWKITTIFNLRYRIILYQYIKITSLIQSKS